MRRNSPSTLWAVVLPAVALAATIGVTAQNNGSAASEVIVSRGQQTFRFDTFGNEPFWTNTLRLHEVIEQAVSPLTALEVGLKVDASVLPPDFLATRDLNSPATTVELLALNAVVGLQATVNGSHIESIGITCALCHSTVDESVIPGLGIGQRLDGWANVDLDPGRIIALSPALSQAQTDVYNSWGPGMYDPRFNIDGINRPVVIPPAYGLRDVALETYTGDGPLPYWNAYVAVTQMHGKGVFVDPRINVKVMNPPNRVSGKLHELMVYQFSLEKPAPPANSFDPVAAERGRMLFETTALCTTCHIPPAYTDVNLKILHPASDTGMEEVYASRSATKQYRTTPLRALWQHPPYFHDGSAPTLAEVVSHYNDMLKLGLSPEQQADLAEYLKTL